MHDKGKLATYIDITKQTIVICWIALFSFWAIKLFGGNFFEILVGNENFVKFSQLVQNTWLKHIGSFISITLSYYLLWGAIFQKVLFKGKFLYLYLVTSISVWIICSFFDIAILEMFYGYTLLIVFSIIINKGYKKANGFICVLLDFVFATISMFTRSIELSVITDYLILMIASIDMYIMYALYFLYSILLKIKKGI